MLQISKEKVEIVPFPQDLCLALRERRATFTAMYCLIMERMKSCSSRREVIQNDPLEMSFIRAGSLRTVGLGVGGHWKRQDIKLW